MFSRQEKYALPYYFFTMRNRGAILARLLSPTRYGTFPVLSGDAVVGLIFRSGVSDAAAGEGFDGGLE